MLARYSLAIMAAFLSLACWAAQFWLVVNTSESFPPGLYRKQRISPHKGDLVLFCPPDRPIFHEAMRRGWIDHGLCPSGTGYMIKRIAAAEGDHVEMSVAGVSVNGTALENSARRIDTGDEIPLPFFHNLQHSEVLLMSPHPLSFDGRYFGIVHTGAIRAVLHPVLLWEVNHE